MRNKNQFDVLLISTADWDNPYWTNKQHVAVQLAKRGNRIFYIESQGLRAPTATGKDLGRIFRRIKKGLRAPRLVRENLYVWSPIVLPWQRYRSVRKINSVLLNMCLAFWCSRLRLKPEIVWTYSPITTELYDLEKYKMVIYHAVDDIKAQPGMPRDIISASEAKLSETADVIFTTANALQEFHSKFNINTYYYPNVADFQHFCKAMSNETAVPEDILGISGPIVGFIGAVSNYKIDVELVRTVAEMAPDISFVFIGEVGEGEPGTNVDGLSDLENIHIMGGRSYELLPGYLKAFNVAILPSRINEYTRSMFPMKFFEYLASGRPIVATRLPTIVDYSDVAALTSTPDEFLKALREAIGGRAPTLEHRLEVAKQQTYEIRTQKMWEQVEQLLVKKGVT